jgi:large subunit ribosomal protein L3
MNGLIGTKIGMTQIFDKEGLLVPVTLLCIKPNLVVRKRNVKKDGYSAVVLGVEEAKKIKKPLRGQFSKDMIPQKRLFEFRDFDYTCEVGDNITIEMFHNVPFVDVTAISKGKGYQGVMKRHNFAGGRKTHGSKFHRTSGSTGMAATPSRVIKGTKMPGRLGGTQKTLLSLAVVKIDVEKHVMFVRGSVPGTPNAIVRVRPAVKRAIISS